MRLNRTTGLDKIRFDALVVMVGERVGWSSPTGRPRPLTLEQAVTATLIYFKNNMTEEVIAELMFVDQLTISRAIADIEVAIADALADWVPDLDEAVRGTATVVDGSVASVLVLVRQPRVVLGKAPHHRAQPSIRRHTRRAARPHQRPPAGIRSRHQRRSGVRNPRRPRPDQYFRRQGLRRHRHHHALQEAGPR